MCETSMPKKGSSGKKPYLYFITLFFLFVTVANVLNLYYMLSVYIILVITVLGSVAALLNVAFILQAIQGGDGPEEREKILKKFTFASKIPFFYQNAKCIFWVAYTLSVILPYFYVAVYIMRVLFLANLAGIPADSITL